MPPKRVVERKRAEDGGAVEIHQKYVKLDQREHVLTCPGMYIGSIDVDQYDTWIFDSETKRMMKKTVSYVPGLFKIVDEILVNAVDHAVRLKSKKPSEVGSYMKTIKVMIDKATGEIEVYNDGDGIEVVKHIEHDMYVPQLIFGNLLTSTNYDKSEERIIGGQNGIGAKACNIFSKRFEITTVDGTRKLSYHQVFETNMSIVHPPTIAKCTKKPYTIIKFLPDYERFAGMKTLSDDMYDMLVKRVYDVCAVTDKDVTVWLNNDKLDVKTFEKYTDLYLGSKDVHSRAYEVVNDRWEVVASYNDFNGFDQVSFVNGIWTLKGGKHVEYVTNQLTKKLIEVITKRKKDVSIKPHIVKENLIVFLKCNVVNPKFDSQSKETLTTPSSLFGSKCEISDKFIDKLYKTGIVEKLVELSTLHGSNQMKKSDGKKRDTIRGIHKLDDANWAGTSKSAECTLILTEGDSAKTMAIAGLSKVGRDRYGVFPLRGKVLNVKDVTTKKISENEEITHLKKILGLESGKTYTSIDDLRYGKIMILTDQDVDGFHIRGLLFNLFHTLWPSLMHGDSFITSMMTPIVKARKNGKSTEVRNFYNLTDFDNWKNSLSKDDAKVWSFKYYKGLGTSTEAEAIEYFQSMNMIEYKYTGENSDAKMDLAFNKKQADARKEWLSTYDRQNVLDYTTRNVSYEEFVDKELIHFSNYDLERSIPCVVDGLKVSQRKILFACFKRGLTDKEIRVAQLAAYVSENAAYHHGEASLQAAITAMAQDFVGSNNINLLLPNGQFGSRRVGGKDASQPRYIHTLLNPVTVRTFMKEDMPILKYLDDDGFPIEPEFYVPIIPMVLVNGGLGIGTGFSTNIPCYNPMDIVRVLRRKLNTDKDHDDASLVLGETHDFVPWYNGFTGTITNTEGDGIKYVSKGVYTRVSPAKIRVTELPIGMWTEDFKVHLEEMLESKDTTVLKSYESNYDHVKVDFTLTFQSISVVDDLLSSMTESAGVVMNKFEHMFKLSSTRSLSTSNMYLFNERGQITKYNNAMEILDAFFQVRLEYYNKRKEHKLCQLQHDVKVFENKVRFINEVVQGVIPVSTLTKAVLEDTLEQREYMKIDDSFDYLTRIPIYNLTKDKVMELEADVVSSKTTFDRIAATSAQDMWLTDLDAFEKEYEKYIQTRNNKMGISQKHAGTIASAKRKVIRK